jgi:hypothetical protein
MLKIWLTCLQPSLSILGVVLVLSNAVSAYASSKAPGTLPNKVSKGQPQQKAVKPFAQPQQFGAKGAGIVAASTPTQGVRVFSPRASASPDDAVRQLALDTIANSERKTPNLATKTSQQNNSGIASFVSPSPIGASSISAKSTKVAATTHQLNSQSTPLVSGLFIGNSSTGTFDNNTANFPNLANPSSQAVLPVVAQAIPTATMMASAKVAEPLPVMQPAQVKPLSTGAVVTQAAPESNSLATNIAKGLQQFLGNEPQSTQKDAAQDTTVAKGLQQFLGNEPKSIQTDSVAPIAKAVPVKTDSVLSLNALVSPTKATSRSTNASSLQLATSKSYDSAADFDLPGVGTQLQAVKTAQPKVKLLAVKTVKTNLSTAVVQRKNNYVALMSDKVLKSQSRQSWTAMSQGNSLGGLILGTRSTNEIASLPINVVKASASNGLGVFAPENQY